MGLPVRRAKLSKDVGQLQGWLGQGLRPATGFAGVGVHVVEWADGGGHHLRADASIPCGGVDAAVAEQDLDDTDIGTVPAARAASRQTVCSEAAFMWWPWRHPGNSQSSGPFFCGC